MSDETPLRPEEDALLQSWLDGELPAEEAAALERRLREDPAVSRDIETLRRLESWLRETRPTTSADLSARVLRRIEAGRATGREAPLRPGKAWTRRLMIWGPAIAAAAAVVVILAVHDTGSRLDQAGAPAPMSGSIPAQSAAAEKIRCVFRFTGSDARQVCLVGSFNMWRICDTPLVRAADGTWTTAIELPRGRHEYMFVVDGAWVTDPAARQKVDDGFGRRNGVLIL